MIRVGPAGWSYPDWEGRVYPRKKPRGFHPLRHLARYFDCVEINSSFYGAPSARNAERWAELVRDRPRFRFTAKLQQLFTHEPLHTDARELDGQVRAFHQGLQPLADVGKLAALLVQFPHSFHRDARGEERLRWIAEHFGGWPLVLELRDRSWFEPAGLALVRGLGYTLAGIDLPAGADRPAPEELLSGEDVRAPRPLAYLRLHGRNAQAWFDPRAGRDRKYDYLYEPVEVREIVQTTRRLAGAADETFVITNNHFSGKAVANALEILATLGSGQALGPPEILDAFPHLRACVRPDGEASLFQPMNPRAIGEREFRLDDERDLPRTIRGRLTYPSGAEERGEPLACVLVLHGFKGFMDWGFFPELARRLVACGLAVVRFNFSGSGHGERPLDFTEPQAFLENTPSREIEDLERVRAWLDSGAVPWIDPRRTALLGHSLGGAVALIHAARRPDIRALVGWASVATFRRFPPEVEGLWRRQGFVEIPNLRTKEVHRLGLGWLEDIERNARALDVHAACRKLTTPTLLLHGAEDEAVPLAEGQSLLDACAPGVARLEVVAHANHTFWASHPLAGVPATLERVLRATEDFLASHLAVR